MFTSTFIIQNSLLDITFTPHFMMNEKTTATNIKWLYLFTAMAVFVNFSGLFTTIIGPDGTLYATIAKTMVLRHDYVNLYALGADWLDKPHFPFWVTALSFNLFGFTNWAYKLPGILFMMVGVWYTYLFAKNLYNKEVALWSGLILLTAQHIVISNYDVRAEPYLTGLVIASVYHLYKAYLQNNYWQLLAGCAFAACAIMTKGMFALIPIGGAIAGHLIVTKQWKQLFNWRWLIAAVLIMIFTLPELYCLYQQFDLHPEKVVFGHTGVSGIRFFFWDSQFGRFFNTGPIKGSGDPTFFVHTTLWAFLPWSLLLFAAIFQFIRKGAKNVQSQEWYCVCGSMLTFLVFSASKFQLPHYLNIVFPFFAILTAQYLYHLTSEKSIKAVRITQLVIISILLVLIAALHYFFRPEAFNWVAGAILSMLLLLLLFLPRAIASKAYWRIGFSTLLISFIVNLYLNLAFYPSLLHYQALSQAAMWINKNNPSKLPVAQSGDVPFAMEFYLDQPLTNINVDGTGSTPPKPYLLFAQTDVINGLKAKGWKMQPVKIFERYWVSRLTLGFLNKATRSKELTYSELVIVR
ncbi:MAG: glycosyl transferase [Mucilaginibacter sp.]|nr:glycosyl transferase [Mucilaginibacter sp.]